MAEIILSDQAFETATRKGNEERFLTPKPANVRYDRISKRIVVEFTNGAAFMVPAHQLQGLETATDDELSEVELLGETGLHWNILDIDYTINGLMRGLFGTEKFMDARRRGGQSKSEAKILAARANGTKGGRPRKVRS